MHFISFVSEGSILAGGEASLSPSCCSVRAPALCAFACGDPDLQTPLKQGAENKLSSVALREKPVTPERSVPVSDYTCMPVASF